MTKTKLTKTQKMKRRKCLKCGYKSLIFIGAWCISCYIDNTKKLNE